MSGETMGWCDDCESEEELYSDGTCPGCGSGCNTHFYSEMADDDHPIGYCEDCESVEDLEDDGSCPSCGSGKHTYFYADI